MKKVISNNSMSIVFGLLFLLAMAGQVVTGFHEHNKNLAEKNYNTIALRQYLTSGHFIQSTFENWESEFLQMALFVVFTIFLKQKGSSESKKFDGTDEVDREPDRRKTDAPWPVRKGGWMLAVYKHSLTIAFTLLFLMSFAAHFYGSLKDENEEHLLRGQALTTPSDYLTDSRFWFESFQNWQSELLSVLAIVLLSIYLRQKGSPQSKPVDAANNQTGD